MNSEGKNEGKKVFLTGLLIGGLLGAAAAYVLGTEDKEELKRQLKKKGKLLLDSLDDFGEKAEKVGRQMEKKIVKKSATIGRQVENAMEDVASSAEDLKNSADENIKTTHKAIKKFFFKKGKPLVK